MSALLAISNLSIAIPGEGDRSFAVDGLSLELQPGEILCVVGESGSGKSMCANAVMGSAARASEAFVGPDSVSRARSAGTVGRADAHHARNLDQHDLPGAAVGSKSGDAGWRPDCRSAAGAWHHCKRACHNQGARADGAGRPSRSRSDTAFLSVSSVGRSAPARHDCHGSGART